MNTVDTVYSLKVLTLGLLFIMLLIPSKTVMADDNLADQLAACQNKVQEYKDWAATNVPKHNQLLNEYERLKERNDKLENERDFRWLLVAASGVFGVVVAIYFLYFLGRLAVRVRRLSPASKQLCVLLGATVWVAFTLLSNWSSYHPINTLAAVLVWSLPAFLLAGILFWWFKKSEKTL